MFATSSVNDVGAVEINGSKCWLKKRDSDLWMNDRGVFVGTMVYVTALLSELFCDALVIWRCCMLWLKMLEISKVLWIFECVCNDLLTREDLGSCIEDQGWRWMVRAFESANTEVLLSSEYLYDAIAVDFLRSIWATFSMLEASLNATGDKLLATSADEDRSNVKVACSFSKFKEEREVPENKENKTNDFFL